MPNKPSIAEWVKIGVLFFSMGSGYGVMMMKMKAHDERLGRIEQQTTRIEHYLSSMDRQYWEKAPKLEDRKP